MENSEKSQNSPIKNLSEEDLGKIMEKIAVKDSLIPDFVGILGNGPASYKLSPEDTAKVLTKFAEKKIDILVWVMIMQGYGEYIKESEESEEFINTLVKNNSRAFIEKFELFAHIMGSFEAFKKIIQETQDVDMVRTAIGSVKSIEEQLKKNPNKRIEIQKDELLSMLSGKTGRWELTKELVGNFGEKQLFIESDPAFKIFQQINTQHFKRIFALENLGNTEGDENRWKMMVARNIYFQTGGEVREGDISEIMVEKELKNIINVRRNIGKEPLFKGRNILYIANAETDKDGIPTTREKGKKVNKGGNYIFGKTPVVNAIRAQGGDVSFMRSKNEDRMDTETNKKKILANLENMSPPLTLIFDGHAVGDKLYLTGGGNSQLPEGNMVYISIEEILESYKKRCRKYSRKDTQQDYFILDCCYGHDFIRNFYQGLIKNEDTRKPIMISSAEYSQEALLLDNEYGSIFMEKTLNLKEKGITTFETLFNRDNAAEGWANPSIFVPTDTKYIPQQISSTQDPENLENGIT